MKNSLIGRDESTALKGFLMLLIVLGHCGLLTLADFATCERYLWWHWLYSFHVHAFLLLPFVYGCKSLNINELIGGGRRDLLRMYVPYMWFTAICTVIFCLSGGGTLNISALGWAFVTGSQRLLAESAGFHFLWFLPSMFAVLMYHHLFYNVKRAWRVVLVVVSIALWILSVMNGSVIRDYVPFALVQGFMYGLLGVIVRFVLEKVELKKGLQVSSVIIFALFSVLFFYRSCFSFPKQTYLFLFILPITFMVAIFQFKSLLSKWSFLKLIGKYSLQIYLVHVIVYNVLFRIICLFADKTIVMGLVAYILTLFISLGIAILMKRNGFVMRYVFPDGK